ncbi:MAG TPA: Spy/CpxP family protein refolding chaperone [Vicinamibacterales bacterium]|nr:Spy/CpxP family protein refolding chaperone [Vicinamibacterales bacterium]
MKRTALIALAGLLISAPAGSQPYGMGPGMMGDYGYGMGPGMMGGYGRGGGYGMRGGYGDGDCGIGPGMMGGYGRGPGYGMGPGMMGGWGARGYGYWISDLSTEQKVKLADIHDEFSRKQSALMESMHEFGWRRNEAYRDGKFDEKATRQSFEAMTELRKQMFENSLELRKQAEAVLTPQQRDQLKRRESTR